MIDPVLPSSPPIVPSDGVTTAERYLAKLCRRSFLSLWSHPCVFRDQGRHEDKGDGKEVCDLLVVFENHVIMFSDKDCRFKIRSTFRFFPGSANAERPVEIPAAAPKAWSTTRSRRADLQ